MSHLFELPKGKKYTDNLTYMEWEKFINNHFMHLCWKVNLLLGGFTLLIGINLSILGIVIAHIGK
jgi:hypothetical protein